MQSESQSQVQLQVATECKVPNLAQFKAWVAAALRVVATKHANQHDGELTIRVVDQVEMSELNQRYRGKHGATDVLSFSFDAEQLPMNILGDVVICAPVVAEQAASQQTPLTEHWAHMVIHGTLHLCGFDHEHQQEAAQMESLEQRIMTDLGMTPPARAS